MSQDGGGGLLLEQEMGAGRHKMLVGGLQLRPRTRHALTFTPGGAGLPALPPGGGEAGLALDSWILFNVCLSVLTTNTTCHLQE